MSTTEKLDCLRANGYCLQIIIPSGKPSIKHRVLITYDVYGDETHFKQAKGATLSDAVAQLWTDLGCDATDKLPGND